MIKRIISRAICLMVSAILMIGVCGCMRKNNLSVDACLEYMKSKYGEEFTYVESYDNAPNTSKTLKIYVESSTSPGSRIFVVQEEVDGGLAFHDNYVAVMYEAETQKLIEDMANDVYGECRILYNYREATLMPDEFSADTSFTEFISNYSSDIYAIILLPPNTDLSEKENKLKQMYEKMCTNKMIGNLQVYYVKEEEHYNSLENVNQVVALSNWYKASGYFRMNDKFEITKEEWM